MRVKPSRLLQLIASEGFEISRHEKHTREVDFVRPNSQLPLFEQIWVRASGKKGDAVYAYVAVSVVKGPIATKGLVVDDLLIEIAADSTRGWTIIDSQEDAILWEKKLASIAPSRATALASERGPELLKRTESVRAVASRYFAMVQDKAEDIFQLQDWLNSCATSSQKEKAHRLSESPGVVQLESWSFFYRLAALIIVLFSSAVESNPDHFVLEDPLHNTEVLWRIDILTDLLQRFAKK